MAIWEIILLAAVQGATEFLPVSSSGHLVIVAALLSGGDTSGLDIPVLNVVLHAGTLLSILVFYFQRIVKLLGEDRRTVGLMIVGTLPAVAIGLPLKMLGGDAADAVLASPLLAGCLLPVTGLILLWLRRPSSRNDRYQDLAWSKALLIGASQAVAILPGLSRSGCTISTGIRLGLAPNAAATFSFLLAIPAIAGASVLEIAKGVGGDGTQLPWHQLAIGAAVAFVVGLICLNWLLRWIERGRLHYFAWWCIPAGLFVLVWLFGVR